MQFEPSSSDTPRARRAASSLLRLPRHALALAAVALVFGSLWHVAALAQLTEQPTVQAFVPANASALRPHEPRADMSAAAAQQDQGDDDQQDAEDGPPPEPKLEQIPVVPMDGADELDVSAPPAAIRQPLHGASPV